MTGMTRFTRSSSLRTLLSSSVLALVLLSACGGAGSGTDSGTNNAASSGSKTVTLVTNDSFAISKSAQRYFESSSGLKLRILRGGDAGATLNQSILTKSRPLGDVFFGVDNTLLTRALRAGLFTPYKPVGIDQIDPSLTLNSQGRVTPVDVGDVCVNYDRVWFSSRGLPLPKSLRDLALPEFARLLVVENPANSSTGLAFMLATISEVGEKGWGNYWSSLRSGGVGVVGGWEQANNSSFSGSAGEGDRPLVVSYATSPPSEVIYADSRPSSAPTGVLTKTCFRQIEGVAVLKNAPHRANAKLLVDFMISKRFQRDLPLQMFVLPARLGIEVPPEFAEFGATPKDPYSLEPRKIAASRDRWIEQWTDTVLR